YVRLGTTRTGYFVLEKYPLRDAESPTFSEGAVAKPKEAREQTLMERIMDHAATAAALRQAAREAVLEHARAGFPVATLENGKVVWLQPHEVFASFAQLDHEKAGSQDRPCQ